MGSAGEMPFLDHLEELRWRIIWSLAALIVGVAAAFVLVYRFDLLTWMQGPILPFLHGHKLVYTHPGDGFSILLQTSIMVGIVIALPVVIWQVYAFLSPALYRHEKRVAIPVILGAVFLFVVGAALAWYFVLPMTLRFLFNLGDRAFDQMITVSEYFGFVSSMVLAMGAVFELPIAILLLSAFGLVTPGFLAKFRRHALLGSYIVAAIITPGDLFITSLALMAPLYLLYELSIILSWLVVRKRRQAALAEAAASGEVPA
ncbi:MAG: twin-arginine translocase subunit TatC [Gemmatimonadaceae bacterium]|nr:twin-arginine translocase subunit TatC [Gemmatimonadaceae bacterium]NUO93731.1 twin-arginine translocase subunit TatC [Gemmatimonadaceae bacterium]NUP54937.1 twin-arginine translocase subunit TatC [Gemmatimonadaceae bacterium]NUP72636.1 twin-arginine translocase subunit TatC [Gemmatimonadaceae bacterium]NUR33504.1 twin-arginine translocase subunit TatC [Gemmatimonadaceae bacterium]